MDWLCLNPVLHWNDVDQFGNVLPFTNDFIWTGTQNANPVIPVKCGHATINPLGSSNGLTTGSNPFSFMQWINIGQGPSTNLGQMYAIAGPFTCSNWNGTTCQSTATPSCMGLDTPNLVQNPGFELGSGFTGPPTGRYAWPSSVDPNLYITGPGYLSPQSLAMGSVPGANGVSQMIDTTANPNQVYMVCFWLENSTSASGSSFQARWNGQTLVHMVDNAVFGWTYFSFLVYGTGNCAGANPSYCVGDQLSLQAEQIPSYYYLDDVSVQLCNNSSLCGISGQPPALRTMRKGKQF